MTSEDSDIIRALRQYSQEQEALAEEMAPLSPFAGRHLMARIDREEARKERHEPAFYWLVLFLYRRALAFSAAVVICALTLLLPWSSSTVQFAMALPQDIKGESPKSPDYFLAPEPSLTVDWKNLTFRIPLKPGGQISGTITPTPGTPGATARHYEIKASGNSQGESITATGQLVAMPLHPDNAPEFLRAKDVYWLKLNLTLRVTTHEEHSYRVFGSP